MIIMSFSSLVKNEIVNINNTRSESLAELSAFLRNSATISNSDIKVVTENAKIARRTFKLVKELYNINCIITTQQTNLNKNNIYLLKITEKLPIILEDLSMHKERFAPPKPYLVSDEAERRAYLRGVFLACGSLNDPKTANYHLELLVNAKAEADFLKTLLDEFNLNSKIFKRYKGYMIYLKEAEKISDFLRIISANQAVLYFEDIRIYRDHKNMINRLNNCEQANVDKIIRTAKTQLEAIHVLLTTIGLEALDEKIQVVIKYRLKYPESSLSELSELMSLETGKKITKSGLNHRFRTIRQLVATIKKQGV